MKHQLHTAAMWTRVLAVLVLMMLLASGCGTTEPSPVDGLADLKETGPSQSLIINVGGKCFLKFSEHGSVGYTTDARSLQTNIVELADTITSFKTPEKMKEGMAGGDSANGVFIFEALKPGVAELVVQWKFRGELEEEEHYIIMVGTELHSPNRAAISISRPDVISASFDIRPGSSGHLIIDLKPECLERLKKEIATYANRETTLSFGDSGAILVEPDTDDKGYKLKHIRYVLLINNSKLEVVSSMTPSDANPSDVFLPVQKTAKELKK